MFHLLKDISWIIKCWCWDNTAVRRYNIFLMKVVANITGHLTQFNFFINICFVSFVSFKFFPSNFSYFFYFILTIQSFNFWPSFQDSLYKEFWVDLSVGTKSISFYHLSKLEDDWELMSVNEENIVVGVAQDRQVVCLIIEIIICSGPSLLILMEKFWSIQTNYKFVILKVLTLLLMNQI